MKGCITCFHAPVKHFACYWCMKKKTMVGKKEDKTLCEYYFEAREEKQLVLF
jgi:hypothetical protein